jgi:hypothetical protein
MDSFLSYCLIYCNSECNLDFLFSSYFSVTRTDPISSYKANLMASSMCSFFSLTCIIMLVSLSTHGSSFPRVPSYILLAF